MPTPNLHGRATEIVARRGSGSVAPLMPAPAASAVVGGLPPVLLGPRFPCRLYEMLDFAERAGLGHVVSWLPHSRGFKIHDRDQFMSEVAPHFFKATKLRSIHRQLCLWGFRRRVAATADRQSLKLVPALLFLTCLGLYLLTCGAVAQGRLRRRGGLLVPQALPTGPTGGHIQDNLHKDQAWGPRGRDGDCSDRNYLLLAVL